MRPRRRTFALGLGIIVAAVPARGMAAAESAVPVTLDGCAVVEDHVRDMVALEMRVLGGGDRAIRWPAVHVSCTGEQARIQLHSTASPAMIERTLDLTGFPAQTRARLLAVEISVLLAPLLEPVVEATPPPTIPPPVPVVPPARPRPHVELGAGLQRLGQPRTFGPGLALGFLWPLHPRFLLRGDLRATMASFTVASSTVRARDLALGVAGLFGSSTGGTWWGIGPGLRAGHVWLRWQKAFDGTWWGGGRWPGSPVGPGDSTVRALGQRHVDRGAGPLTLNPTTT